MMLSLASKATLRPLAAALVRRCQGSAPAHLQAGFFKSWVENAIMIYGQSWHPLPPLLLLLLLLMVRHNRARSPLPRLRLPLPRLLAGVGGGWWGG